MPYSKDNWKGNPNGRPKGSQNKFTSLKDSFIDAFKSEEINGTKGLIDWAKKVTETEQFFIK